MRKNNTTLIALVTLMVTIFCTYYTYRQFKIAETQSSKPQTSSSIRSVQHVSNNTGVVNQNIGGTNNQAVFNNTEIKGDVIIGTKNVLNEKTN